MDCTNTKEIYKCYFFDDPIVDGKIYPRYLFQDGLQILFNLFANSEIKQDIDPAYYGTEIREVLNMSPFSL